VLKHKVCSVLNRRHLFGTNFNNVLFSLTAAAAAAAMPSHNTITTCVTFVCTRCRHAFRKRKDGHNNNTACYMRGVCRTCSTDPDEEAERRVVHHVKAVMSQLMDQGKVSSYTVMTKCKVSKAELASVHEAETSLSPPESPFTLQTDNNGSSSNKSHNMHWCITVTAKIGTASESKGLQTQLVHIELDGWKSFSSQRRNDGQKLFQRIVHHNQIKERIVQKSTTSRYGERFKRVSLFRVSLVRKPWLSSLSSSCSLCSSSSESRSSSSSPSRSLSSSLTSVNNIAICVNGRRQLYQRKRSMKLAVDDAIKAIKPFLTREFSDFDPDKQSMENVQFYPPGAFTHSRA